MSDNPIINAVGTVISPFGAVGKAVAGVGLAKNGMDAFVKSITPKLPEIPDTTQSDKKAVEDATAIERRARSRSATLVAPDSQSLAPATLFRRTLLGQ